MNYSAELKKFLTSQYIFSGARIALAIVIPSVILAYFGLLREFFLFPLGTSFVGLTDQPGPFIRRRNTLALAILSFFFVAMVASFAKDYDFAAYLQILIFGVFFSLIGVYGARLGLLGALSLVILSIFIDGHLIGNDIFKSLMIFLAGCTWFLVVFMIVSTIQPYKLASQLVGENYLELSEYLQIKAQFYKKDANYNELIALLITKQIKIKELQEDTREVVFKTRKIVNESTTQSRILMLMFLNSIDLFDKLITSENDYKRLGTVFGDTKILEKMHQYLLKLSEGMTNIGISLQSGTKINNTFDFDAELKQVYDCYYDHRLKEFSSKTLEDFMLLRQVLMRITDVTDEIKTIIRVHEQDIQMAKSLSSSLDLNKFLPNQPKFHLSVLTNNISFNSGHFRHAIKVAIALLIGFVISKISFLQIGHSYWILITIIAIIKPSYSATKQRNKLRIYGTICGGILAYILLYNIHNNVALLAILLTSMTLCFSFLKARYFWAVLFMTIYIFLTFNFLNPGNLNLIFKDRMVDTAIAGAVTLLVSYFIFPVWEHTQNIDFMKKATKSNLDYFRVAMDMFINKKENHEDYRLKRKSAIIDLANLSDNFHRMISDPKDQKKKFETVHQFVTTSHLLTAYIASLVQFAKNEETYPEIDAKAWKVKISSEIIRTISLLHKEEYDDHIVLQSKIKPEDHVESLIDLRKKELDEKEFFDRRDTKKISHLTELKSIQDLLELIYDVAKDQRKVVENYYKENA